MFDPLNYDYYGAGMSGDEPPDIASLIAMQNMMQPMPQQQDFAQPMQQPQEPQGLAQQILSARFQPSVDDIGNSAAASISGDYISPVDIGMKRVANAATLQKTLAQAQLYAAGGSGNQTIKLAQAIQAEHPEMSLTDIVGYLKNTGTTNPLQIQNGGIGGMKSAQQAAAEITGGKQDAQNKSDLQYKPDIARDTKLAENDAAKLAGYAKAQSNLAGFKQQSKLVTDTVDNVLKTVFPGQDINVILADQGTLKPSNWSTGYGVALSPFPNTDSRKVNNYLNTIKANIGFDKLQQMRENSPTGGALGQVSDFENKLLQAVNGALDPAQSDQFVENMKEIRRLYPMVLAERERAFQTDYGKFGGMQSAPAGLPGFGANSQQGSPVNFQPPQGSDELPDPAQHRGRTITDTSTNRKYTSNGSQWVPQ